MLVAVRAAASEWGTQWAPREIARCERGCEVAFLLLDVLIDIVAD